jgi:hypothetical protein|uniref:Uncharacterized protein n=1 Tax=Picea glauca TaxID=3330 RepID=A0A101LYJ3_PICGL|nr:hypothetical protein ABT39_MTgene5883 [Picea glauca]QHR92092.1 hypothetical protein Q903MT_gene6128 [Picea sitchensis]
MKKTVGIQPAQRMGALMAMLKPPRGTLAKGLAPPTGVLVEVVMHPTDIPYMAGLHPLVPEVRATFAIPN